jgi:hypothetical protein
MSVTHTQLSQCTRVSSIVNFNIAFSGPECLGGTFATRWWTNAMAPMVIMVLHAPVYYICLALAGGDEEKKKQVSSAALGSWALWCKLIYMAMMQLVFDIWLCTPSPVLDPSLGGAATLDADPSLECPAFAEITDMQYYYDGHRVLRRYAIVLITGAALLVCFGGCVVGMKRLYSRFLVKNSDVSREDRQCWEFTIGGIIFPTGLHNLFCPIGGILLLTGLIGMMATGTVYAALLGGSLILFAIFFVGFIGGSSLLIVGGFNRGDKPFRVGALSPPPPLPPLSPPPSI